MIKKLIIVGNSFGFIIEWLVLGLFGVVGGVVFGVKVGGEVFVICFVKFIKKGCVCGFVKRMMVVCGGVFGKLVK